MDQPNYIQAKSLSRHYQRGPQTIKAIDNISVDFNKGNFYGVVGSSGSGKSTLLNLLAGLDTPTAGEITVDNRMLNRFSRKELSRYRAETIGIIFQSFNLIQHYTALENVSAGLMFQNYPKAERIEIADKILERLGIAERRDHRPADLSGGEQQRVAIARALAKSPEILLADEPTGNLDRENSLQIVDLLTGLKAEGITIVMVTHDLGLANRCCDEIIKMDYGKIIDRYKPDGGER